MARIASPATTWLREQARPVRRLLNAGIVAGAGQAVLMCLGAWLVAHLLAGAIFHARGWAQASDHVPVMVDLA